ncbi:carboxypeptidase-like regulatory domain-containing protein, partial [Flavobacteriaceae bacterium]|nr:carboxypeptidase-like regulatory domain-containing protein [Flavobacteriaceae bacterium]
IILVTTLFLKRLILKNFMKGLKIAIAFFFGISSICSQHKINGKIIDENNEPLSYANIILHQVSKSENPKGTISDDKGMFTIENIFKGKYTIEVSMLGFKTYNIKEFELVGDKTFNIILKEERESVEEVKEEEIKITPSEPDKIIVEEEEVIPNVNLKLTYSFGSQFGKKKSKRDFNRDEENRIDDSN